MSICNFIIKTYNWNMKYKKMSIVLGILLYFNYYTFWLLCCLPDDDLWKPETCWRYNVLTVILHTDFLHLVVYNKTVYMLINSITTETDAVPDSTWLFKSNLVFITLTQFNAWVQWNILYLIFTRRSYEKRNLS